MEPLAIVQRRLHRQGLHGPAPDRNAREVVAYHGAVQAQEYAEAKWSIAQRTSAALFEDDLEQALADGSLLRTHVLRATWHYVAPEDIRWMQRLTGPRVQRFNAPYARRSEVDDDLMKRAHEVMLTALAPGEPLQRKHLADALRAAGIDPGDTLRMSLFVMDAELECLIASGPRDGKQHTYLSLDGRAPAAPQRSRDDDLDALVLRYFTSHGPATVADFAWWSSLTKGDTRAALARLGADLVTEVADDGTEWIRAAGDDPVLDTPGARLLGSYDETTVAYKDLRVVIAGDSDGRLVRPVLVDGRTVGTWKRVVTASAITLEVIPFVKLDARARQAISAEADRFGAFFGLPAAVAYCD